MSWKPVYKAGSEYPNSTTFADLWTLRAPSQDIRESWGMSKLTIYPVNKGSQVDFLQTATEKFTWIIMARDNI